MHDETTRAAGRPGFTLVELMITVVILAVLVALAFPTIKSGLGRMHMQSATNEVMNLVDFARIQAIARNRAYIMRVITTDGGQRITLDERPDTRCSGDSGAKFTDVRQIDFAAGEFRDVRIVKVAPTDLGATFNLCFRPDGSVVRSDDSRPIAATDEGYGAGEARIVLRLLGSASEPVGVMHQVVVPYNGIPRFEPGAGT